MSARRHLRRFAGLGLAFVAGAIAVAIYPIPLSAPDVTIDVADRRYACGDCAIRFGINRVHGAAPEAGQDKRRRPESPQRFDGWDVLVLFRGSDTLLSAYQAQRFARDPDCAWPLFRLKGQFKRRLIHALLHEGDRYDGIYFDAASGVAINTAPACRTFAREIPLPSG